MPDSLNAETYKLDIWNEILDVLTLEMTQATFNTWLVDSKLLSLDEDDNLLVIGVRSDSAVEFLNHRWRTAIERVVRSRLGSEANLQFIPLNGATTKTERAPVDPPPATVSEPEFKPPAFDTHEAGWFPVSEYECRFWAPYLGRVAWRVWEIVRTADRRKEKTRWTPARRWTAPSLASQVPCGRQAITGVNRKCDPDHADAVLQEDGVHRRYQPGAFDRLQEAEIAEVERRGQGPHTTYRVRVLTKLPLLTPKQVGDLRSRLQVEHDRWLADRGFDPADWDV